MCCKCCQYCLESCYWHLIEKRFCYDESIALYEEPEKEEKNNNVFDNMAFYDSVAVIAGRSIVTIDPLPQNKPVVVQQPVAQRYVSQELAAQQTEEREEPIVQQPTKKLQFSELKTEYFSKSVPLIFERTIVEEDVSKSDTTISNNKEASESEGNGTSCSSMGSASTETKSLDEDEGNSANKNKDLLNPDSNVEFRRKSLLERRMSKSLYLKIDHHKEIPIIRQNSMPKFYLDTPQPNQTESSIYRTPSTALASPVKPKSEFVFDLYSVVQLEKNRMNSSKETSRPLPQKDDRSSKLFHLKDKIKLRRVKSSLATITSIPHTHHI